MKYSILFSIWITILVSHSGFASDMPEPWESDIEVARQRAEKEKKGLLLAFLGPSTTKLCQEVNEAVLANPEFTAAAGKDFSLFYVLAPEDARRDAVEKKAYRQLLKEFKITAYPILLLANSEAKVYAKASIDRPDKKMILESIRELRKNEILLTEALPLVDAEGDPLMIAKRLSDLLDGLTEFIAFRYYPDLVARIIELDADNTAGLKDQWERRRYTVLTVGKFDEIYLSISHELWSLKTAEESVALMDATVKRQKMGGELAQLMELQKFRAWATEKNYPKMLESLKAGQELAPHTHFAKKLGALIPLVEKALEKAIEEARKEKQEPSDQPPVNKAESKDTPTPGGESEKEPIDVKAETAGE